MRARRLDRVTFIDLDFIYYGLTPRQLAVLVPDDPSPGGPPPGGPPPGGPPKAVGRMHQLYEESFDWLYYRPPGDVVALPGMERFDVTHLLDPGSDAAGASLLVKREYGIAVASVWRTLGERTMCTSRRANRRPRTRASWRRWRSSAWKSTTPSETARSWP